MKMAGFAGLPERFCRASCSFPGGEFLDNNGMRGDNVWWDGTFSIHPVSIHEMLSTKEGKVDMCTAIEEMRKEAAQEAASRVKIDDIRNIMEGLKYSAKQAMDLLKISESEQKRLSKML